jgi:hypothetical protein
VTLDLQQFQRGLFHNIQAVQLTPENVWDVFEWADSKPFIGPATADDKAPIIGLTIFEPIGRNKASFGDWVYRTPAGDFRTYTDAEFHKWFTPVEGDAA